MLFNPHSRLIQGLRPLATHIDGMSNDLALRGDDAGGESGAESNRATRDEEYVRPELEGRPR